jgi:hypothetical protein
MSKSTIDYSNTIIYKIFCKDPNIKDIYVGHTTNFIKRKYHHKLCSLNNDHNEKIYKIIREYGGWDNWDMVGIEKYNCKDLTEARIKEQEHYDILKASLNSKPPYPSKSKLLCIECKIQPNKGIINKNINDITETEEFHTQKINTKEEESENQINITKYNYNCILCNFKCIKSSDWNRHMITTKHKNNISVNKEHTDIISNKKLYLCKICNKKYYARNSLWYHENKCKNTYTNNGITDENNENKKIIQYLIEENAKLTDIIAKMSNNQNINNNII